MIYASIHTYAHKCMHTHEHRLNIHTCEKSQVHTHIWKYMHTHETLKARVHIQQKICSICLSESGLFCLIWFSGSSIFRWIILFFPVQWHPIVHMYYIFINQPPADELLDWFNFLGIVIGAAINVDIASISVAWYRVPWGLPMNSE